VSATFGTNPNLHFRSIDTDDGFSNLGFTNQQDTCSTTVSELDAVSLHSQARLIRSMPDVPIASPGNTAESASSPSKSKSSSKLLKAMKKPFSSKKKQQAYVAS
jgi:hypothetical protein